MQIGVFSDIHDQLKNLEEVLKYFEAKNIDTALFCGDFCSPFPVKIHLTTFKGTIHAVYGNTEDRYTITALSLTEAKCLRLYGESAELEFDNNKVALTHYPIYANALAQSGKYDAVFYGHNHIYKQELIGNCLLANPGEVAGFKEEASFSIWDTKNNGLERIFIDKL